VREISAKDRWDQKPGPRTSTPARSSVLRERCHCRRCASSAGGRHPRQEKWLSVSAEPTVQSAHAGVRSAMGQSPSSSRA
jgi:hypothetical protein